MFHLPFYLDHFGPDEFQLKVKNVRMKFNKEFWNTQRGWDNIS